MSGSLVCFLKKLRFVYINVNLWRSSSNLINRKLNLFDFFFTRVDFVRRFWMKFDYIVLKQLGRFSSTYNGIKNRLFPKI